MRGEPTVVSADAAMPSEQGDGGRPITRRSLLKGGLSSGILLALGVWGIPKAFAGVGGGGWGNNWGTAYVGSSFGYDGGWGYSRDGRVWLSVSSNCSVPRMSELLCEISVTSYYANGGVWSPTWYTDYADTHVDSYIRNDAGTWLSSASGFFDTTYDSNGYHGPYVTNTHTVRRESWDWWAWAGVRAWCDSNDSAYGIDTRAEGTQLVPHHTLNDDKSWRGRIFTMSPRCSPNLVLDVGAGKTDNGSTLAFWAPTDRTNQLWTACSNGGDPDLTVLEPMHLTTNMAIDQGTANPWGSGEMTHLWGYHGGTNQLLWLHAIGNGYHYPVFQHSGMALNCAGAGKADGTAATQQNCFQYNGGTADTASNFLLTEVTFRERSAGAMTLSGTSERGRVLTPANPNDKCLPYNYPGTSGMFYKYAWYRGSASGARTETVRAASETAAYTVQEADEGLWLTCVVEAWARFWNIRYKGEVVLPSTFVPSTQAAVRFFADGEKDPCYTVKTRAKDPFTVPQAATVAATKPDCSGLDGWYTDASFTKKFVDGTAVSADTDLYARNRVSVTYDFTSRSKSFLSAHAFYADSSLVGSVDVPTLTPAAEDTWYGKELVFAKPSPPTLYYDTQVRVLSVGFGRAYLTPDAVDKGFAKAKVTRNTTVYLDWNIPAYDGVMNINRTQ